MKRGGLRHAGVDLLKVLAAQCIVLHHFAWFGPTWGLSPGVAGEVYDALAEHARIAVQVFLVAGGFLAAQAIDGWRAAPLKAIVQRHLRLVAPMAALLIVAMLAAAVARPLLPAGVAPEPPTWAGVAAHLLLLQDVLGHPSLSTGLWYIAIDFQLSALLIGLVWLMRQQRPAREPGLSHGQGLPYRQRWQTALLALAVLGLAAASLLHFNRDPDHDIWAPYFFGAYALGVAAAWSRDPRWSGWPLWAMIVIACVALFIEWRTRIAVALAVALLLAAWPAATRLDRAAWLSRLSRTSYALFLVHFPVFLLVAAAFARWWPGADGGWAVRIAIAWAASMIAADLFERFVERPLMARSGRRAQAGSGFERPQTGRASNG